MASLLPSRLLSCIKEDFSVIDPRTHAVKHFDIISYDPESKVSSYQCSIDGVNWDVDVPPDSVEKIRIFMIQAEVQYIWVGSLCIDQNDEVAKKYEYLGMPTTAIFCWTCPKD